MRHLSLTFLLCALAVHLTAQPWLENLPAGKSHAELTFFDYQKAFEAYWAPYHVDNGYYVENGENKKAPGWKQFKRWEYIMEHRADMKTGAFPERSALDITLEFQKTNPSLRTEDVSNWTSLGPSFSNGGGQGIGRMNCVAFHPTDINTYWAGAASGGLWFTSDDGQHWTCLTDKTESLGITDIVIPDDYDQSHIIYIATGDRDSYDNNSVGVLKSTDGGITWNATGLTYALKDRKFINRLIQHPANPAILIAATIEGVFRTTDGGITWDEQLTDHAYIDMEFHPADPQIIYGSDFEGDVYVSINDGTTWTRRLNDFVAKRIELAVTPAAPNLVYAIGESGGLDAIYKSTDSGMNFVKTLSGDTLNMLHWDASGTGSGGQGFYDLGIAASPLDANTLLIGGINTWRSQDGGHAWTIANHFTGSQAPIVHADKHSLRFRPNGDLWECNDGGIYVSHDGGNTWIDKTNGIAISQMYRMGVSATDPDEVITGLQDNGSKLHSATGWEQVNGGDGMEGIIDHTDINIQYSTTQSGSIFRTLDRWTSARYVKPNDALAGAWVTPFAMDPVDPKIIYGGFSDIWKTTNRGDTWTKVSTFNHVDKIRSIAIAPSDPNVIYVAGTYYMWKSTTGGEPFVKVTGNVPDDTNAMAYISVKHDDPQTAWVAVSGFSGPGVYETIDGGTTWTNISSGMPKIPVYTVIQNKQATDEVELFAGTELGVYFKKGNEDWILFSNGLPNVIVSELEMYYAPDPTQSKLRAATYGRGLWETRIAFVSSPMVFVSATTKQGTTESVKPNVTDQEILKIEIHASGDLDPLHAKSFTFNTEGSTDPSIDIARARLYYSGSANGFNTDRPFGEPVLSPDGIFTFENDMELVSGVNYFWLAYDVAPEAGIGNILDAQCSSFNIGTDIVPEITAPDGSRLIELIYCTAGTSNLSQDFISRVVMGSVDQISIKGENGYQDFTDQVIEMEIGMNAPVAVTNNAPHSSNELRIWVDWNIDGDFDEADELMYASGPLGITTYNTSFTPPASAKTGMTRMRIRLHDTSFGPNETPCGIANLGEVEDYTISVSESSTGVNISANLSRLWVYPNPVTNDLVIELPGNQQEVNFELLNAIGTIVHRGQIIEKIIIPMHQYPAGIYFINAGTTKELQHRIIKM